MASTIRAKFENTTNILTPVAKAPQWYMGGLKNGMPVLINAEDADEARQVYLDSPGKVNPDGFERLDLKGFKSAIAELGDMKARDKVLVYAGGIYTNINAGEALSAMYVEARALGFDLRQNGSPNGPEAPGR